MSADPALNDRGPYAINTNTVIAVGARLVVQLIGSSDKVMFTGNQDAALLHDVGGKTSSVSCGQHSIQTRVFQYRRACLLVTLRPSSLTGQQAQFTVRLAARNTKEAELLDTVQRSPGVYVLSVIAQ